MTMHTWCVSGSSPRMRGAHEGVESDMWGDGIIPAYAGSTATSPIKSAAPWDHPRVCGEHNDMSISKVVLLGSSPRMRGALLMDVKQIYDLGIIPAYAGSTRKR